MRNALLGIALLAACHTAPAETRATVEVDGSWSRTFAADRDAVYHAALATFDRNGYTLHATNPLAGTFSAKSPIASGLGTASYTLAHVVVETTAQQTTKLRLQLVRAREPVGGGRRPNNDLRVDRKTHEAWLEKIAAEVDA